MNNVSINQQLTPADLQIGDRVRFRVTECGGNGYAYFDVLDIHEVRCSKWPWDKRTRLLHEVICFLEPTGYPDVGAPWVYPLLTGKIDFEKEWYPLSYGVFHSISRRK